VLGIVLSYMCTSVYSYQLKAILPTLFSGADLRSRSLELTCILLYRGDWSMKRSRL
jgi:hypothetical protein